MATTLRRVVLVTLLIAAGTACTPGPTGSGSPDRIPGLVLDVPDGDSLVVDLEGTKERVRLIGINAPESNECFGPESAAGLAGLLAGAGIELDTDVESRDQYGRLLAYVWVGETFVNEEVARRGLVLARAYEPNTSRQDAIDAAGREARANLQGLWSMCGSSFADLLTITQVAANPPGPDDENLNGEFVVIRNRSDTVVDLSGWVVRDSSSVHRYVFAPGVVLEPDTQVAVHTGCGPDTPPDLFWCASGPVWDNAGDSALLLDAGGAIVSVFDY